MEFNTLSTNRLYLKIFTEDLITDEYISWLNNPKINQYLEVRFQKQTISTVKNFVKFSNANNNILLYAITLKGSDKHIGNIKIGPIDNNNNSTSVGYMIGDSNFWNKGYATEAMREICRLCFEDLGILFIDAGLAKSNEASAKLLTKCGFEIYSVARKKLSFQEGRVDEIRYCINKSDFIYKN